MNKWLFSGLITVMTCGYLLWLVLTPVEIVAVHNGNTIMVKHFPWLKNRQIDWWEANKNMINAKYGLPHKRNDGSYSVFVMDFGGGYRTDRGTDEDADLLCFDDIKSSKRCVEKKPLLWIGWSKNSGQFYR